MKLHFLSHLSFKGSGSKTESKFTSWTLWGPTLSQIFRLIVTLGHCWSLPKNTPCIWRDAAQSRPPEKSAAFFLLKHLEHCLQTVQPLASCWSSEWLLGRQDSLPTLPSGCTPHSSEMPASNHSLPSRSTVLFSSSNKDLTQGFNLYNAGGLCRWPFSWKVLPGIYNSVNNSSRKNGLPRSIHSRNTCPKPYQL